MNSVTQRPLPKSSASPPEYRVWWFGVVGFVGLMLLYFPACRGGFIWDDDVMLTDNVLVKGGWGGLLDIWFSTKMVDYFPMTSTSFWVEWHVWGNHAAGYHLTNVLLHAGSVFLLWRVLRVLKIPGAWLGAMLFAVHPVCVASVAWIAERKNTLSMVFYLLSILLFLQFEEAGRKKLYWFSLGAFVFALLSKTSVVVLPIVLLICVWWMHSRIDRGALLRIVPYFIVAVALGLVTVWFQVYRGIGAFNIPNSDSFLVRLLGGSWAVWFYLFHAVAPIGLTMIYPRWLINPASLATYLPLIVMVVVFTVLWRFRKTWGRSLLFVLAYSVATVLPVLGFFNIGFLAYSRASDHWQYLQIIGPVALLAAGIVSLGAARRALASIVVVILAALSWNHQRAFLSSTTLWTDVLSKNPTAWVAHDGIGVELVGGGKVDEAIKHYRTAIELNDHDPMSHANLATALSMKGQLVEAERQFRESLWLNPDIAWVHGSFAVTLALMGRQDEAMAECRSVLKLRPDDEGALETMGTLLLNRGKLDDAAKCLNRALQIEPDRAQAHWRLGNVYASQGQWQKAIDHLIRAVETKSDFKEARADLGLAYSRAGRLNEAGIQFKALLRSDPKNSGAHCFYAETLTRQQRWKEAIFEYREGIRLGASNADAFNNLAWILATNPDGQLRDGPEAVKLARKACDLSTNQVPEYLGTLDASYAEAGRFEEAIATARRARAAFVEKKQPGLAEMAQERLSLYARRKPFHSAPQTDFGN